MTSRRDVKEEKRKTREIKHVISLETLDPATSFTLPDSLSCSESEFPVLLRRKPKVSWDEIVNEADENMRACEEYNESKKDFILKSPFMKTECDYLNHEVFPVLIPALEETLNKAKLWDALLLQKCLFNGIDHIVQVIWNNNPRHPYRRNFNEYIFNMPWVKNYLKEHPRPYYPKSWLWPEDYAAILIQKTVRQYFVQRLDEVQEMREFWKKLKFEKENPEIYANPILARKFAIFRPTCSETLNLD